MLPFATSKPTPFFSFVDGHPGLLIVPNCTSAGQRPHVDAHGSKQRRTDRRGDLRQESRLLPDARRLEAEAAPRCGPRCRWHGACCAAMLAAARLSTRVAAPPLRELR